MSIGNSIGWPHPNMCTGRLGDRFDLQANMIFARSLYFCCSIMGTIPPIGWTLNPKSLMPLALFALSSGYNPPCMGPLSIISPAVSTEILPLSIVSTTAFSTSENFMSGLVKTSSIVATSTPMSFWNCTISSTPTSTSP